MFQTVTITPSPVSAAFSGIQWDPLGKLRLTDNEKSLLRSGEDNPVDYTLSNVEDATLYVRALLKVLTESAGASGYVWMLLYITTDELIMKKTISSEKYYLFGICSLMTSCLLYCFFFHVTCILNI